MKNDEASHEGAWISSWRFEDFLLIFFFFFAAGRDASCDTFFFSFFFPRFRFLLPLDVALVRDVLVEHCEVLESGHVV